MYRKTSWIPYPAGNTHTVTGNECAMPDNKNNDTDDLAFSEN